MDIEQIERPGSLRRSQSSWRVWLASGLFEGALIIVSVIVGLLLTGWAQDQADRRRVEEMRGFILKEISANRALVLSDDYLPHHKRLSETIGKVSSLGTPTREQAMPAFQAVMRTGIHLTPADDSVWRSIAPSDLLEHMPPEKVFVLTRVYRIQDDLRLINENVYALLTRIPAEVVRGDPPAGPIMQLQLAINDLIAVEEDLVAQYDTALKSFDPDDVS